MGWSLREELQARSYACLNVSSRGIGYSVFVLLAHILHVARRRRKGGADEQG